MTEIQTTPVASAAPLSNQQAPALSVLRGARRPEMLRDELLCEIFDGAAKASPQATAFISDGRLISYAEAESAAHAIARGLLRAGVRPGDIVGLWMARGVELLTAQIAIAKTGAAWLPFDADAPLDRIAVCLADAGAKVLLTSEVCGARAQAAKIPIAIQTSASLVYAGDQTEVDARRLGATPDHPAYLIYTSGSTGVPKGIVVTQRNICHYLRSANDIYGLRADDVMFQGASVAFDLSMEEIWIPYLVGATLFVATPAIMGEADKLPEVMEKAGVTVLDTVPTLLALISRDIPSLRVIILGGEACPPSLGQTWCRPGRSIFNSYGPTEATVVATVAMVRPNEPVTIGRPIPNYSCYVADENLNLLHEGQEGELLIGGPGVARGYLKRDSLTAEKFVANPFGGDGVDPILYRSGDAVAIDAQGNISFRGRIDDQVKIRGFRVELGEIESQLSHQPGVNQATVVLRNDDGMDQLVAFVVPARGAAPDAKALRLALRAALPPYMVPARFETLDILPRLPSGKVNRNALKRAPLTTAAPIAVQEEPETATEAVLLAAAKKTLPPQAIPFDADFFTDLGGHSLIAARFVSLVRETPALAGITLQDVYATRSLRAMALMLDKKFAGAGPPPDLGFAPPPLLRRFLCGLAQAIALPFILALMTAQWLSVFVSYMLLTDTTASILDEIGALLGVYVSVNILTMLFAIFAKWALLGRTKPGRYPLWGVYYFRWWLHRRILELVHLKWFQGSPILPILLRAFGAKVGNDCIISEIEVGAIDLVSIGDGATLGGQLYLANVRIVGNEMIIGSIDIGADCSIGTSCVIEGDVAIGQSAELRDLTSLQAGARVGPREIWDGSPGRPVDMVDVAGLAAPPSASAFHRALQKSLYVVMLLVIPPIGLLPILPAFWVFDRLDEWLGLAVEDRFTYLLSIPIMAWPTAFVMVLITVGFIAICRWAILPVVKEGDYSVHSWFYFRKWVVGLATEITLEVLSSLFATVYMRAWYRLMGAKIGKDAEISCNLAGRYDLVEIGEKCFIADEVVLGDEEVRRGWMILRKVRTGARVFIGNDGVVPPGANVPDGALIGIKSKPPANDLMREGDTWFGSPPMKLPVRQRFDGGGANWTYEAPWWKKSARAVFEAVHISLPTMLFITFGTWAVELFGQRLIDGKYGQVFWLFVLSSVLISVTLTAIVIVIKWLTMGRYEPVVKPMWSWWAMRTEAVAVMYWGMAGKVLLDHLRGTPFLPMVLRLFGVKIGKGCYMDMTDITEYDCVTIGDYVSLNSLCALQTHLYEDRVMKVGRVAVGNGVTVGSGSTVLYDTKIGDFAQLGPLTLVMKGESIPPHTQWVGAPAEPKGDAEREDAAAALAGVKAAA